VGRRGILPSLGAGTSLIVAGVLLLAVVSSIIAFRGFPGLGPDAARPPVRLATPAADGTGRSAPAPIVVGATVGSATLAAPVRRPQASSARTHADGPAVRIGSAPSAGSGSGSSPVVPISDPVTSPPPAATPSAGEPDAGTETPEPTSRPRPVRQTVDRVRDTVAPVPPPPVPPAAQPIVDEASGLVDTANDVVDQAAGVADDVIGGVLPGPAAN
jgi:hypothetical protein